MSCAACRNVLAPATSDSGTRSCWITWSADSLRSVRSFSVTNMKPELVCVPPVKPATLFTFGLLCTMRIISENFSFIAWNDVDWSARMPPIISPVSCCGKKPFGTTMYR